MKTTLILLTSAALSAFSPVTATAADWKLEQLPGRWTASGFEEALDISGIASLNGRDCIVGSDELPGVQLGTIDSKSRSVIGGDLVPLLAKPGAKKQPEIDVEGVAVSVNDNCYYVTGSHGAGKKKGDFQPSRHTVFEIPVDPVTGAVNKAGVRNASLLPWLEKSAEFATHVHKPLQANGFNIEGLAFKDGRLWFGIRGPNVGGNAYIIETTPASLFGGGVPECKAHALPLGADAGIRDIIAIQDGFLLVSGNSGAEASKKFPVSLSRRPDSSFDLHFWTPGTAPKKLGPVSPAPGKAEAMLVLEDTADHIDLLVLFDGAQDGAPLALRVIRGK